MTRIIRLLLVWFAIMACVAVIFLPGLIHQFDDGTADVLASQCRCDCDVGTSNVRMTGRILEEYAVEEETTTRTRGGSASKSSMYFVPVVGEGWRPGEEVCLILMQHKPHHVDTDGERVSEFPATLQNVLWEGPDDEIVDYFKNKVGLNISENVVLAKQGWNSGDASTMLWIVFVFFGLVSGIPIFAIMIVKRKRS